MAATAETPVEETESEKVVSWRLHVLIEAGYPADIAKQLAHADVDLHYAVDLVVAGCAAEIAAAILL